MKPKAVRKLLERYRIDDGAKFRLADHDPRDTAGSLVDPEAAPALLAEGVARLADLQTHLYADRSWSVLCVFQAIDAAGKDGTIKHVMSGVNPQGVQVTAFKAPGPEELAHGYLWRIMRALPERGHIGIFNRSHYEEVLVARVHPEILHQQRLPPQLIGKHIWKQRLHDIVNFEAYMARQGTVVLKFFLHLSRDEQKRRFLERIDHPAKNWKFSADDVAERRHWDAYMHAYQAAIRATATPEAPWYVVPADHKWFTRLVVVRAMIDTLERLKLKAPELSPDEQARLLAARQELIGEV